MPEFTRLASDGLSVGLGSGARAPDPRSNPVSRGGGGRRPQMRSTLSQRITSSRLMAAAAT